MKGKRILSAVLSAALLLQLSPLAAFAEDTSLLPVTAQTALTEPAPEEPTPEPAGEETALPEELAPEETAVPMAAPTPEPTAEPTTTPAAEESAPDAAETPAPEPSAEPTAAPDPAAEVQAMIDALPDEVTEDNAEAVEQALTDIDDAKESLTDEELAGLDFARYDAAANALLALWGEVATDEVELLDANAAPSQDPTDNYYLIDSVEDLYWFANEVNNNARTTINARLTADIKLNGENKVLNDDGSLTSNADNLEKWKPIGTDDTGKRFTGIFDGNNKTISGLYYNNSETSYVGLFGCVGKGGTVKNVNVTDSYVSGKSTVGGICGWNDGGTLQNCHNAGTVSGAYFVGGVCGINNNSGTIQKCDNAGTVSGTNSKVGGVCGSNGNGTGSSSTTIQECYNTGKVSGKSWVGGVCGQNTGGTLEKSYNTNTVTGTGNYIGGVCGDNYNSGTVKECYSYSTVRNVCGDNSGIVENCYYLSTKSGTAHRNGGISKTEAEFNSGEVAYLLQNKREQAVWGQKIGTDDYPKLGGDKVYQSAPCPTNYSNTSTHKDHNIGADGKCTACGTQCIAYTVTIPATVQLGTTATIKAKDVILPNGKTLNVKVAEGSEFKVALDGNPALDTCEYTVTDVTNKTATKEVTPLVPVLTAVSGESEKTVELQFNKPESTTYSGTYTGTVTFTVSVDNKS